MEEDVIKGFELGKKTTVVVKGTVKELSMPYYDDYYDGAMKVEMKGTKRKRSKRPGEMVLEIESIDGEVMEDSAIDGMNEAMEDE